MDLDFFVRELLKLSLPFSQCSGAYYVDKNVM